MKTLVKIILAATGIGFFYLLAFALCKAAGRADRAIERMSPPKDYEDN